MDWLDTTIHDLFAFLSLPSPVNNVDFPIIHSDAWNLLAKGYVPSMGYIPLGQGRLAFFFSHPVHEAER